jgi:hypothetical protein
MPLKRLLSLVERNVAPLCASSIPDALQNGVHERSTALYVGVHDEAYSDDASCDELRSHAARVCTHAHEYLTQLLDEWKQYAHDVDMACRAEATRAKRAFAMVSHQRSADEHTYRKEVAAQLQALDESIDIVRTIERPRLQRTESFKRACQELREGFAAAYGSVPTPVLSGLKQEFETGMREVQRPLARDLVAFVTRRFGN